MDQLNLFDFPKYKIKNKIRLIELFAGIGSQSAALRNIGANYETWRVCEFDKYAIQSYNAVHGTNYETSDITKIHAEDLGICDRDLYTYLMTYSFPCTDLSVAGKMAGMKKGSGTRSGLLWEVERLLIESGENLPQVLLMENVPQVVTAEGFNEWLEFLKSKGYHNFYKILNAKNYGIAQNRERCFMVSIQSPEFVEYEFPEGKPLTKTIKDYLQKDVEEKFYINTEKAQALIKDLVQREVIPQTDRQAKQYGVDLSTRSAGLKTTCAAIVARYEGGIGNNTNERTGVIEIRKRSSIPELLKLGNVTSETSQAGSVYSCEGLSPTLCAGTHGYAMGNILETKK